MDQSPSVNQIEFRKQIIALQDYLLDGIKNGIIQDAVPACTLRHYFTGRHPEYGCYQYARELFIPAGVLIVGKIHRHEHLNFLQKGKLVVATEDGVERLDAPMVIVSAPGAKRAGLALEDSIWVTVHTVRYGSEESLEQIEHEVIAPCFDDLLQVCGNDLRAIGGGS